MSVLINMEMPEKQTTLTVFPNGYVAIYDAKDSFIGETKAFPVPPHGRLIEESKVLDIVFEWCPDDDGSVGKDGDLREMLDEIEALPTIIPEEKMKEET